MGMMPLSAISAGACAPLGWFDGQIHSVFASAANLRIGDDLIALLAASHSNQPRGIRLTWPDDVSFERWLSPGATVACRAGIIRFSGSPLQIDLRPAQLWCRDLTNMSVSCTATAWHMALSELSSHPAAARGIAASFLALMPPHSHNASQLHFSSDFPLHQVERDADPPAGRPGEVSLGSPARSTAGFTRVQRTAHLHITTLLDAAHRLDALHAEAAASSLVGLGPGLTPSGDDFLVGFTAGQWVSAGGSLPRIAFQSAFCDVLARIAGRTTDISRGFLLDAAQGQASQSVIELACAFEQNKDIQTAALAVLRQGSTSGADTLAGFLAALAVWAVECKSTNAAVILRGNHDHSPAHHPESLP